ncbi:hypothetical protein ACFL3N_00990, partial [Candidatus Omnitrophota bacterium]
SSSDTPEDTRPLVRELIRMTLLHQIRLMERPAIPKENVLWHILDEDLLAESQKSRFAQGIKNYYNSDDISSKERVYVLRNGQDISDVMADIGAECENAIFDVALSNPAKADGIRGNKIKMLIFEGSAGDLCQVEGILAALNALHLPNKQDIVPALLRIYRVMGAMPLAGNKQMDELTELLDDPKEFARGFIYLLPSADAVPVTDMPKVNERMKQLIISV